MTSSTKCRYNPSHPVKCLHPEEHEILEKLRKQIKLMNRCPSKLKLMEILE